MAKRNHTFQLQKFLMIHFEYDYWIYTNTKLRGNVFIFMRKQK